MNGNDLICLSSSDEDEPQIKKKRMTPLLVENTKQGSTITKEKISSINQSIICLDSDEDINSQDAIEIEKNNIKTNGEVSTISKEITSENIENVENTKTLNPEKNKPSSNILNEEIAVNTEVKDINGLNQSKTIIEKTGSPLKEIDEQSISHNQDELFINMDNLPCEAVTFLSTCKNKLEGTTSAQIILKKFPTLIRMFKKLAEEFTKSDYLKNFLNKQTKIATESVSGCIVSFKDVYQHLKSSLESDGVELSKKHRNHVKKLEKMITQLLEKLKKLDEDEVDFDADENDSPYIKHERYSQRLGKVYKKYCQILKKNPYAGRITYERLAFVSSSYNEINLAICKKYKNNSLFPSYDELATYIESVVEKNSLPLSGAELKAESKHCFKKLGELLQVRRQKELYEGHCSYILNVEDPAEKDPELDNKLRVSSKEGSVRIEQIYEEFAKKQELGINNEEIDCNDTSDDKTEDEEEELDEVENSS